MKKPNKKFYTVGGFCYAIAKENGLLNELEELFKKERRETSITIEKWHENEGEFFLFGFDTFILVANLLGYKPSAIHHAAKAISMLLEDFYTKYKK